MRFLFAVIVTTLSLSTFAQGIKTEFGNKGLTIKADEAKFRADFRFRVQSRFTYQTESADEISPELAEFIVRRARLRFEGHVLDPRLLYKFQFSFTRGDMDFDRTEYPNILRDAAVGWKLTDATTLWYGQTKLPGNRERLISSGAQQFVDRSIVNATFNFDRDMGAQIHHVANKERPIILMGAISNGEGRGTENPDAGMAYSARAEWRPLGDFKDGGDDYEGDLARETTPKIAIGAAYNLNKKATRSSGTLGSQFETEGLHIDLETYFVDFTYKYAGFSVYSEYAHRWSDKAVVTDGAEEVGIYKGQGLSVQSGYLFDNNVEPSLRFSALRADHDALAAVSDQNHFTAGLSKYFNGHKVKIQSDLTFEEKMNSRNGDYSNAWVARIQLELGI